MARILESGLIIILDLILVLKLFLQYWPGSKLVHFW